MSSMASAYPFPSHFSPPVSNLLQPLHLKALLTFRTYLGCHFLQKPFLPLQCDQLAPLCLLCPRWSAGTVGGQTRTPHTALPREPGGLWSAAEVTDGPPS